MTYIIKPLAWINGKAVTPFCNYAIKRLEGKKKKPYELLTSNWITDTYELRVYFTSAEEAVNAATKDYEDSVKECLIPSV